MDNLQDIDTLKADHASAKESFVNALFAYHNQEALVNNLIDTKKTMEATASGTSEQWLKSLVDAGGVQTEETERFSLMAGMAKENLERITPAISKAKEERLTLLYKAAEAANAYKAIHRRLCAHVVTETGKSLLSNVANTFVILRGLIDMSPMPEYEFVNLVSWMLGEVKKKDCKKEAMNYIEAANSCDAPHPLGNFPISLSPDVDSILRKSPSATQMILARRDKNKMEALISGKEECRGFGG